MQEHCPAVVHIDGTARPQIVDRETNPGFHEILSRYHRLSGVPCVVNTSFNMHEEPIVRSPEDAVRSYQQGKLDNLAVGPFLLGQPPARHGREG
jgi:carbamoyltransferase